MRKIINKLEKLITEGESLKIQLNRHYQKLSSRVKEFKNNKNYDLSDILNNIYSESKKEDTKIEEMAIISMIGSLLVFLITLPISIILVKMYFPTNFMNKIKGFIFKKSVDKNEIKSGIENIKEVIDSQVEDINKVKDHLHQNDIRISKIEEQLETLIKLRNSENIMFTSNNDMTSNQEENMPKINQINPENKTTNSFNSNTSPEKRRKSKSLNNKYPNQNYENSQK